MILKTTTKFVDDKEYTSENISGNVVEIDMKDRDEKKHQSPMELMLSAIAACGAVDIVAILKKKRKTVIDFEVQTTGERREEIPKKFIAINCHYVLTSPNTDVVTLEKVCKMGLEKYCSVSSSLNIPVTFTCEVKEA